METYAERREENNIEEKAVHNFMIKHFYSKFPTFKTNDEKATQIKGVDCEFDSKDGTHWIVDEKAVTGEAYINPGHEYIDRFGHKKIARYLPTFCLELSMRYKKNKGSWIRYPGWLLNNDEINNAFMFIWIDKTRSGKILNEDDILEAEVCLVSKDKLWGYLENLGWDKNKLRGMVVEAVMNPENYDGKTINGVKFSCPMWLLDKEAPVNILLKRDVYRSLADFKTVYKIAE